MTSLSIHGFDWRPVGVLTALVELQRLTHLAVKQPWIYDQQWVAQFASPALCQLESLTLDWCVCTGPEDGVNPSSQRMRMQSSRR